MAHYSLGVNQPNYKVTVEWLDGRIEEHYCYDWGYAPQTLSVSPIASELVIHLGDKSVYVPLCSIRKHSTTYLSDITNPILFRKLSL